MSEKGRYYRTQERLHTPDKIWDEYRSGLEKYEATFAGFGPNAILNVLMTRKSAGLRTKMFDVAASGALIKELHGLGLIDSGVSITLVDPRQNPLEKIGDLLFSRSSLRTGDIVHMMTFLGLSRAQVMTFRPVGAFDDYPEDEYTNALRNCTRYLDEEGVLFAQFPANSYGRGIINNLGLNRNWSVKVIEDGYSRAIKKGYHAESTIMVTHPIARFERSR